MELRNNSERSRAELAATMDKLRTKTTNTASEFKERISIPSIKREIRGQIRESSGNFVQSLKIKVRENPLQAVAVGAGLAYPLWNLLRRIPMPFMLVGAGFWLASENRHGSVETELTARAAGIAAIARDTATDGTHQFARTVSDATQAATVKAKAVIGDVSSRVNDASKVVTGIGKNVQDNVSEASDVGVEMASNVANRATLAVQNSQSALLDFAKRNPMIIAGSGLALGAFIAASIPRSDVEDRLIGQGSNFIKNKVRQTASDGVEHAMRIAATVVGDVVASAAQQGLSGEGLGKAVEGLTAGIKAVATKGAQAALGGDEPVRSKDSATPNEIR
jgi:ElaB/YqjD/DUF883 family membrane-anchored ribosome-binding protein